MSDPTATKLQSPEDTVEITWSGDKKLLIKRKFLDQWYDNSYENRDWYVKEHKFITQAIPIHQFKKHYSNLSDDDEPFAATTNKNNDKAAEVDMSQYVVVHWAGKGLLLKREQLDDWYDESPAERAEFVAAHPDAVITEY